MKKYIESNIPNELIVRVAYVSRLRSKADHNLPKWMTVARLLNKDTNELVAVGQSVCSEHDTPSKKIGRAIAVGRALLQYDTKQQGITA